MKLYERRNRNERKKVIEEKKEKKMKKKELRYDARVIIRNIVGDDSIS